MWTFNKALDGISRTDEAVFAMDPALRITQWNKACEELLGQPARAVLGRPCYEVLRGRDANGNRYCHRNCPVAYQAREEKDHPVRPFALSVRTGGGSRTEVSSSLFSIPSYHPALATLVHVLRRKGTDPVEEPAQLPTREPLARLATTEGNPAVLTSREQHILACLAKGLATPVIAKGLLISPVTVRNHISNILRKLDVHTKLAAVVLAYGRRLV